VDDEVDVCYLLSAILRHKNLEASYVNTISDAKRALLESNPFIIFLDNHLPDGFGVNFIEEIKNLYPNVKIVMITAHDTTTDRDKAYKNGVDQFIGKPFTRDIIFKTLESLLN
jgi:Response regulator containing CheY-like receiver, AAA-type ATPase, and DNA-binding domains